MESEARSADAKAVPAHPNKTMNSNSRTLASTGTGVPETGNVEIDKNDHPTPPETENSRLEFGLKQGMALINLETETLIEVVARPKAAATTTVGFRMSRQEYGDKQNDNQVGQNWGDIIYGHQIAVVERDLPPINQHGEILAQPKQITDETVSRYNPESFRNHQLMDGSTPYPLLVAKRPQAAPSEHSRYDSYEILGWYDQTEPKITDRIKPVESMGSAHPEAFGEEPTTTETELFLPEPAEDASVSLTDASSMSYITVSPADSSRDNDYTADLTRTEGQATITKQMISNSLQLCLDVNFNDMAALVNSKAETYYNSGINMQTGAYNEDTLSNVLDALLDYGLTVSVDPEIISTFGSTVTRETAPEVETTMNDIIDNYGANSTSTESTTNSAFETMAAASQNDSPRFVTYDPVEDEALIINSDPDIDTIYRDGDTIQIECPIENNDKVKSLPYDAAQYSYDYDADHWTINSGSLFELLNNYIDDNHPVAVDQNVIETIEEEVEINTSSEDEQDPHFAPKFTQDETDAQECALSNIPTLEAHLGSQTGTNTQLIDIALAFNQTVTDDRSNSHEVVPEAVINEWNLEQDANETETLYSWYNPLISARIVVSEANATDGQYEVGVKNPQMDTTEVIATPATSEAAGEIVLTHLKTLTSAFPPR